MRGVRRMWTEFGERILALERCIATNQRNEEEDRGGEEVSDLLLLLALLLKLNNIRG